VNAFLRFFGDERMLVINSFNDKDQTVKISIPEQAATQMGLDLNQAFIARDMLWREAEVGFDKNLTFELRLKPYSSFILKIK
jgi:hypothetical protein